MTDKFELNPTQNYLHLDSHLLSTKKHGSLLQYRQLIIELSNAINQLNQANHALKSSVDNLKNKNDQYQAKLKGKEKQVDELRVNLEYANNIGNQCNRTIDQLKNQCYRLEQQSKQLRQNYLKIELNLSNQTKKRQYIEQLSEASIIKIKLLQESYQQVLKNNNILRDENTRKKQQSSWSVQNIKQFNQELRRKFQCLEIDNLTSQIENIQNHPLKQCEFMGKKCFSTEKKRTKRNIGFLSTNNTQIKKKQKKFQEKYSPQQDNIKPFKMSLTNPQLGSELLNLKKQIAHQYTLMSLKTEKYSKQRVTKTLQQLKIKMSNAIISAQQSQQTQSAISP